MKYKNGFWFLLKWKKKETFNKITILPISRSISNGKFSTYKKRDLTDYANRS